MIYYYAQSFTRWSAYMFGGIFAGLLIIKKNGLDSSYARNPISIAELDKEEVYANCESNQPALSIPFQEENQVEAKMTTKQTYSPLGELVCTVFGLALIIMPIFLYRPYQNNAADKEKENWSRFSQTMFAVFGSWSVVAGLIV